MENASAILSMQIEEPDIVISAIEADLELLTKRKVHFREIIPETGFLRDYFEYARELTDSPEHYHLFVSMGVLGTALGRKVWIPFGLNNIYPNIYLVLLAESSFLRKSTALTGGKNLLRETFTEMAMPDHVTLEKMLDILAKNATSCFFPMEFASFISMTEKSYNEGMMSIITELFDCPIDYRRSTKGGGDQIIKEPFLSILAASTFDWFNKKIKQSDIYGGFLARFLFVPAYTKTKFMAFPPEKDQRKLKELKRTLGAIAGIKGKAIFNDDCKQIYSIWLESHEEQIMKHPKVGLLSGFMTRLAIYALKFALIYHFAESKSLQITPQAVYRAILAVEYLKAELFKLADETFATPLDRELIRALKQIGKDGGITMREFYRNMGISKQDADRLKQDLLARDRIEFTEDGKMIIKEDV